MNKVLFYSVLLVFVTSTTALIREPVCSTFHYDEQMLEKMIRTEIKFEELQKLVQETLKEMKEKNEEFKDKTREVLERTESLLKIETEKVESGHVEITKATEKMQSPRIVFKSKTPTGLLTLNEGQTIIFTETMYNYGSGYNNQTGEFVAPASGTYLFTVHLCSYSKTDIHYGIVVEGNDVTRGRYYNGDRYACAQFDAVVVLNSSDKVWVQCYHNNDQLFADVYRWNTFSGVLIN